MKRVSEYLGPQKNDLMSPFFPAPTWLLDLPYKNKKKKIMVEITGTLGGWYDGEYNGCKAFVTEIFRTASDTVVAVSLVDPGREGSVLDVPIKYLSPLHPNQVGDYALGLEGEVKGIEVRLGQQGNPGVWDVLKELNASDVITCRENEMVKLHLV